MSTLSVYAPFDGRCLGEVELIGREQAEAVIAKAKALWMDRSRWLPAHQRLDILRRLASLMESEQEGLALGIAQEGGKPLADARIEVQRAIAGVRLAVAEYPRVCRGEEIPMLTAATEGRTAITRREPIGVVLAISAFNHPLNLLVHQAIPAIAVGCPVILKPSLSVPLTAQRFVTLVKRAGLPEDWLQLLLCETDVTASIARDASLGFVSFIGSSKVGWEIKRQLAPGVRCCLEHGEPRR